MNAITLPTRKKNSTPLITVTGVAIGTGKLAAQAVDLATKYTGAQAIAKGTVDVAVVSQLEQQKRLVRV